MELQNQTINNVDQSPVNTSGQGRNAIVPKEIKDWNWGAFLSGWMWGLSHHIWFTIVLILIFSIPVFVGYMCLDIKTEFSERLIISLIRVLILSPIINFAVGIVLGIKGNEWVWRIRHYVVIREFKIKEKKWVFIGMVGIILEFLFYILIFNIGSQLLGYRNDMSNYTRLWKSIMFIPHSGKKTNSTSRKTTIATYTPITNTPLCSDTDGGKNYLMAGTIISDSFTGTDSCGGPYCPQPDPYGQEWGGCFAELKEYYCENGTAKSVLYRCGYEEICEFGACLLESSGIPHTIDLKINGSDGPITVPYGSIVTAKWNSTGDMSCRPSGSPAILVRGGTWKTNFKSPFPLSGTEKIYARTDDPTQKVLDIYIECSSFKGWGIAPVDRVTINLTTKP